MEIKFIDTSATFLINGHEFVLDVGEIEPGEKAEALKACCFEEFPSSAEGIAKLRDSINQLLGEGAADRVLAGCSPTNEVQIRRMALAISGGVLVKRTEMVLSAFGNVRGTMQSAGEEKASAEPEKLQ